MRPAIGSIRSRRPGPVPTFGSPGSIARSAPGFCCCPAGGRRRSPRLPRTRAAPNLSASRAVLYRRLRHARRRLHLERHRRPRPRRQRRAHALAADPVRPGQRPAGGGLSGASVAGRLCGAALVQRLHHRARHRLAGDRRGLSVHEAHHLLAADRARPRLLVGSADGLGGGFRPARSAGALALRRIDRLGHRLRHDLRPSGPRGRCADRHQIDRAVVRRAHQADAGAVLRARGRSDRRRRIPAPAAASSSRSGLLAFAAHLAGRSYGSILPIPNAASLCSNPIATPA